MKSSNLVIVLVAVGVMLVMAGCPKPQPAGDAEVNPEQTAVPVPGEPTADSVATPDTPADTVATDDPAETAEEATAGMITTDSGLQYEDLVVGDGAEAVVGKTVYVHYTGWLEDGTKFDSSLDHGDKFDFPLGGGRVIPGWDEGVQGMKVGGKRKLVIPSDLAYGAAGAGGVIPPNATLTFEIELFEVE